MKKFLTNYRVATKWLNNSLIMCNHIGEIDPEIYDNMRFSLEDEETSEYKEIYQWFITDCNKSEVIFLEEHFGLLFTYSPLLDCYILAVDHYGTAWDYVYCDTDLEQARPRIRGEEIIALHGVLWGSTPHSARKPTRLELTVKEVIKTVIELYNIN